MWAGRRPSAAVPVKHIGGAPTLPCPGVRPSPFGPGRSSPGLPGQKIPFHRQLADLSIQLASLALARLLAFVRTADAAPEKTRGVIENLHLPAVNLVGMNAVALGQLRNRRFLAQSLQRYLRLERRIKL